VLKERWDGTVRREPKAAFWMGASEDALWICGGAGVITIFGMVNAGEAGGSCVVVVERVEGLAARLSGTFSKLESEILAGNSANNRRVSDGIR